MFNIKVIIHETHFNIISFKEERIQKESASVRSNMECWAQLTHA
jgi:hypothetical protein